MAGEKKLIEDECDKTSECFFYSTLDNFHVSFLLINSFFSLDETKIAHLKLLHQDLARLKNTPSWDGYLCYLYGIVLRKLELPHALQVLQDAVNLNPLNWAAWFELANLVKNSEMVIRTLTIS